MFKLFRRDPVTITAAAAVQLSYLQVSVQVREHRERKGIACDSDSARSRFKMRPPQSFGVDITNMPHQLPVMMAGRAIIRVVGRCNEAQENCNLGE